MFRIPVDFPRPVDVRLAETYTKAKVTNRILSAVGVNPSKIWTVPQGTQWFVNWAMLEIVTNANILDRYPLFTAGRNAENGNRYTVWRVHGPTTPASNQRFVMLASWVEHNDDAALFGGAAVQVHTRAIPRGPYLDGDELTFGLNGAQGGDYLNVHLVVDEVRA